MDLGPLSPQAPTRDRHAWRETRRQLETASFQHKEESLRVFWTFRFLGLITPGLRAFLKMTGLYRRGTANALDIQIRQFELSFPHLPDAFDGFTLMQLSDLHLEALGGTSAAIVKAVRGKRADALAITGDFQIYNQPHTPELMTRLAPILEVVDAPEGQFAILGNHDSHDLVERLESLGMTVLVNESVALRRGGAEIILTGLDDVHWFHTPAADAALATAPGGFRIALVHSPEFAGEARDAGYDLYLCGHTHQGQIALPGGRPILTGLKKNNRLSAGLWRLEGDRELQGYTSPGAGVNGLPIRFFTRPEVTLITLRRAPPPL